MSFNRLSLQWMCLHQTFQLTNCIYTRLIICKTLSEDNLFSKFRSKKIGFKSELSYLKATERKEGN